MTASTLLGAGTLCQSRQTPTLLGIYAQMEGETLEAEVVKDRLLLTY